MKNTLLLSTRKGLLIYERKNNGHWEYVKTEFLAIPVTLAYADPYTGVWWALLDHGHWGCKLHVSHDKGSSWKEIEAPKYPEGEEMAEGKPAVIRYLWAINASQNDSQHSLWIGTEPGGLFSTTDNGESFSLNRALWEHPSRPDHWFGGGRDYAGIHSIVVDPRDSQHIFVGVSVAGVFETIDGGKNWMVRNKGLRADFLPDPNAEVGHDPHLLVACENNPDILWQQNHCGIFMSEDGGKNWKDVSEKDGPANFGFTIAVDANDGDTAWVVPAISDEKRIAVDQALCVCRTTDGGKTWVALREGLPQKQAYDLVYRHALATQGDEIIFGTTTGNVYISANRGDNWEQLTGNLPMVYALSFAS